MKNISKILAIGLIAPWVTFAQTPDFGWLDGLVESVGDLVDALIPVVIAIGLLFFIWGLVKYIAASGDESAKEEGKRKMVWGIISLFIIVTVWGFVAVLAGIFGVTIGADLEDVPVVDWP